MNQKMCEKILTNWDSLHEFLPTLREDQLEILFDHEIQNKRRKSFILRIHQRFASQRLERERIEIMSAIGVDITTQ